MKKPKFSAELIKEYGEQIWRDNARNKKGYVWAAETSYYVAEGSGQIKEEDKKRFINAIIKYARTHKRPKKFI